MKFMVNEKNFKKRVAFYKYIITKYDIKDLIEDKELLYTAFPFVIDFDDNILWICNSITVCACATQCKKIIDINSFKKLTKKH